MRIGPLIKMSAAGASTVIVGLNGALQKRFILPQSTALIPGNVHRAAAIQVGVGGKGQDVAVTLSCLGYKGGLKLAQFVGVGPEGDQVYDMLADMLGAEALDCTVRPANSGMRTCTSIVASDATTELVEPSGIISHDELGELLQKLKIMKTEVAALCFMGSLPPGLPETTYGDIYKTVATSKTLCVIDSMAGLEHLIHVISDLKLGSTIFKVNASELCKLANVKKSASESSGVASSEIFQAINQFLDIYPRARSAFNAIAITDGAHPAYLAEMGVFRDGSIDGDSCNDMFHMYRIPITPFNRDNAMNDFKVQGPLYPIGAGDAVAAGLLSAWKCLTDGSENNDNGESCLPSNLQTILRQREVRNNGNKILTCMGFGLACGSASCLEEGNSVVKQSNVVYLFQSSESPVQITYEYRKQAEKLKASQTN